MTISATTCEQGNLNLLQQSDKWGEFCLAFCQESPNLHLTFKIHLLFHFYLSNLSMTAIFLEDFLFIYV